MVNLGLLPYVGSKLFVLSLIVGFQCLLLFGSLKFLHYARLMKLPGSTLPQLLIVLLTGILGIALGLFVSALVKTSEMATSLVPLILIPQILFSGLVGLPQGVSKVVGVVMPATWAFDEIKRFSTLDTLREEGSKRDGPNRGRGLFKHIEDLNDEDVARAQHDIEKYRKDAEENSKNYQQEMRQYLQKPTGAPPSSPKLASPPEVAPAVKVNEDLTSYIDFLHPWGGAIIDPLVLFAMLVVFVGATVVTLRAQDIL